MILVPAGASAVDVVLASGGYPDAYPKGKPITGLSAQHQWPEDSPDVKAGPSAI